MMTAASQIEPEPDIVLDAADLDEDAFPGSPVTLEQIEADEAYERTMEAFRVQHAEQARLAAIEQKKEQDKNPWEDVQRWIAEMQARPWHPCKVCGNPKTQAEGGTCGDCEDARRARVEARERENAIRSAFPERYRDARFDSPSFAERVRDAAAVAELRAALATTTKNFVLLGPAGSGKTTAACAAAFELATRRKCRASFTTAFELGRARAASKLGEEPEVIEDAMHTRIAVIDELGRSRGGHHDALPDVVFARHDSDATTIWTSGAPTVEALEDLLADAGMARRILEGAFVVTLKTRGGK